MHGLEPKKQDRQLQVAISLNDDFLIVSVKDNGIGRGAAKAKNGKRDSYALNNVSNRLSLHNNTANNTNTSYIHIEDLKDNDTVLGTKVTLKFKV